MSKPKTQSVPRPGRQQNAHDPNNNAQQEPLSGSKTVKNENHTRHNNGEG